MTGREIQTVKPLSLTKNEYAWRDPERLYTTIRGPKLFGYAIMLLFFGGFGWWGWTAPLAGGAMAQGTVSPEGELKTIQHLEGGRIRAFVAHDGDRVEEGAPLLVLDDVKSRAEHAALQHKHRSALIRMARLRAESDGALTFFMPRHLETSGNGRDLLIAQKKVFKSRKTALETRKRVLRKRLKQQSEQLSGYLNQADSAQDQLELVQGELDTKRRLFQKRIVTRPEILRLERNEAELQERLVQIRSAAARARHQIGETEVQLALQDAEYARTVAKETEETSSELIELQERLRGSEDVLRRTVIRSPVAGTVTNLRKKTVGAIVKPGESIMDIVPNGKRLLIDARISPMDIDIVKVGLPAQVHMVAYAGMSTPRITGVVRKVAAHSVVDEQDAKPYFRIKVEIDPNELQAVAPNMKLSAGMPANVLIVTEKRTMLDYLWQPFDDAIRRGMREAS